MGQYDWVPSVNDVEVNRLLDKIVNTNIMATARSIYKNETGKACNNHAMERCLRMVVTEMLGIVDRASADNIHKTLSRQQAVDMIISGVVKGIKEK